MRNGSPAQSWRNRAAVLWVTVGRWQQGRKKVFAAGRAFRRAIALDPGNAEAWLGLARVMIERKRPLDAIGALRTAFRLDPRAETKALLATVIDTGDDYADVEAAMEAWFDRSHYLATNSDVARLGLDPVDHYLVYGWKEHRSCHLYFESAFYAHYFRDQLPPKGIPLVHFALHGVKNGQKGNPASMKRWFEPKAPAPEDWDRVTPARLRPDSRAAVLLPVYKGYDETLAAVHCALAARGDDRYALVVINDRGPDEALNAALRDLAARGLFEYHENAENLGFVRTINRGIADLSAGLDVVLLNSDAFVFPGWFGRLVAHADADPAVATVTPLSNNATICSYPRINVDNAQAIEVTPAELDRTAASTNPGIAIETPTGVGFCFYMRRAAIDRLGPLDTEAFKLGYGEENDFCMRALETGQKNLIACDVFVYHVGSVSFSAIKEANFKAGQDALIRKHPQYPKLTQRYVGADPGRDARRALDLARLARAAKGAVVFVSHTWGGGIETYLQRLAARLAEAGQPHFFLRVQDLHWVSVETGLEGPLVPNLNWIDMRIDAAYVGEILAAIAPREIHVDSMAGLDWTSQRRLMETIRRSGLPYVFVGHDYAAVSHNLQLLAPDGVYRGLPDRAALRHWARMRPHMAHDLCDPDERIEVYADFLAGAARIEVPSRATRDILLAFHPGLAITVVPHDEPPLATRPMARRARDGVLRVAVVGAIGGHKGSDLLRTAAADAGHRGLPIAYTVVGYTDDDPSSKAAWIEVTGRYRSDAEAVALIRELEPDLILIPSIWPETYCYTLSFAFQLGIPAAVFDLGAQGERVRAAGWGILLDPQLINAGGQINDVLIGYDMDALWAARPGEPAATACKDPSPATA